ncbi:ubiquitin-conjugating enzyme/RWD-like protein, partial [Polychytrium aggregatum]|uniref:ubiquitin-conjugating enzyme/RWD-like protein n=1 Tax=Polychytrium aggregatum TaxID=110093 RepID=UPI0022FDE992
TPYAGGTFKVKLTLGSDFPQSPPKGYFVTKIFHPNVSKLGEICVNTLKKDWSKDLGIAHVLLVIKCLLIVPNPESALNEEAGRLLLENYEEYARHAQMMTSIHANQKVEFGKENRSGSPTDEDPSTPQSGCYAPAPTTKASSSGPHYRVHPIPQGEHGFSKQGDCHRAGAADGQRAGADVVMAMHTDGLEVLGVNNGPSLAGKKRPAEKRMDKPDKKRAMMRRL